MTSPLILPGYPDPPPPPPPPPPAAQQVRVDHRETVLGVDGRLYELRVEGTAELTRGPLGRFIDLADQIEAEGLTVPSEIRDVLDQLNEGG